METTKATIVIGSEKRKKNIPKGKTFKNLIDENITESERLDSKSFIVTDEKGFEFSLDSEVVDACGFRSVFLFIKRV